MGHSKLVMASDLGDGIEHGNELEQVKPVVGTKLFVNAEEGERVSLSALPRGVGGGCAAQILS